MKRLDGFVQAAHQRIQSGYYHVEGGALAPPRPFLTALEGHAPVIAELKPRTPSQGLLFEGDARQVLADYVAGGATGLSVLADADFFDGSIENLRLGHATGLPVLFKDFVVDEAQLDCAQHHGCAAVLLIERILDPTEREALVKGAHARGMQVVLEIHNEEEWATAQGSAADIIGVNARDLDTLRLDRGKQADLVRVISGDRPVLSLSGVRGRKDRVTAQETGARGVLVGTMLMQHTQRRLALMSLRNPLVKVCGLTQEVDVVHAIEAGADLVGFIVLSPDSPRNIDIPSAIGLVATARRLGRDPVLVTRSQDIDAVITAATAARPAFVQFHSEAPGARARLSPLGCGLLAAIGPAEGPPHDADGFVLDNGTAGHTGGTGETHDWERAADIVAGHPHQLSLIAGGLDASNVQAALAATGAWGADASSRLESEPGIKDPEKVSAYVAAATA